MEPTKNNNQFGGNSSASNSGDPIFRGMPKVGQPAPSTPSAPTPSTTTTPKPTVPSYTATPSSSISNSVVFEASTSTAASTPSVSSSAFKPVSSYVPPQPLSRPSSIPNSSTHGSSTYGTVNAPLAPLTSPTTSTSSLSTPTATANKLSSEVNQILNSTPTFQTNKSKSTLMMIMGIIVALLVLAGGAYYWYAFVYTSDTSTNSAVPTKDNGGTMNTAIPKSSFPPAVRNSQTVVSTSTKATPAPAGSPFTKTPTSTSKPSVSMKPAASSAKPTKARMVPFTQDERDQVSAYIESNINRLTSVKSSVPFEVTDVTFDGPDRALVQYTNGKSSYTSLAVASIDASQNVRIASFALLEK